MPKNEFDFEDPFELNGMAFLSHEDTTNEMAECFAEEFLRMGYNHKQVLALFRNPQYLGPHMALEKRGEPFIRELIAEVFARWGKVVTWPSVAAGCLSRSDSGSGTDQSKGVPPSSCGQGCGCHSPVPAVQTHDETVTDPMGAPIPKLNI